MTLGYSAIVAVDKNNGIGYNDSLLCCISDDMKHFREITMGKTIVMGRKTFQHVGFLKGRTNIVLTRDDNFYTNTDAIIVHDKEEIPMDNDTFIIGGAQIYSLFWNEITTLYVTHIKKKFDLVDAYFPDIETKDWKEITKGKWRIAPNTNLRYRFCTYRR